MRMAFRRWLQVGAHQVTACPRATSTRASDQVRSGGVSSPGMSPEASTSQIESGREVSGGGAGLGMPEAYQTPGSEPRVARNPRASRCKIDPNRS